MNRYLIAFLLAAVATPSRTSAQTPPDSVPPDSVRVILRGVFVSVARPGLTSGGATSVVVELDSLGSVPAPTMDQVLRAMPLIQLRTNSRGETQPALRGAEDRQIAILMDGVPLTLGWDHRTDMSIIPLTAARRVTLVRGLSSVLYGPNTLGGVVEVDIARTRSRVTSVDPIVVGLALDATGGTNVSVTGGRLVDDEDSQWVFRAGGGFQDRRGVPIAAKAAEQPGIRTEYLSDGELRLNSDARRRDGFFMARYRADRGSWASLSVSGFDVERGVPPEAHQDTPRLWRYPHQRRVIAALTGGTGQRDTGAGVGDLEASLGIDIGSTLIQVFTSEAYTTVDKTEDSDDQVLTARLLGDHSLGARGQLRAAATYGNVRHTEVLNPGGANRYQQQLWSFGVETEWRLGARDVTSVSLGVAVDGANTPASGDKPPLKNLIDYGVRIGASSLVGPGVLVHGGVSRRSRFPSLRELYSEALGRFEANPGLRPETLLGSELGFTATGAVGEIQLVGFYHRLEDGIVRTTVAGPDSISRFQRANQDHVTSAGVELLLVGDFGATIATGDLTIQGARGRDAGGNEVILEYEPAVVGKLGIDVPLPARLRGGGQFRFVSEQRCQNPEIGAFELLASSKIVDLSLRRIFSLARGGALSRIDVSASVRNATDAVVFDQCGLPQPGRLFQLQLRVW